MEAFLTWGQKNLLVSPPAYWFLPSKPSRAGSSALAYEVWNWIPTNQTAVPPFLDVLPGELPGFMLILLKQANFKLIMCWRILPCWILAGCFCKLWKINVKYADVFCLKQMFGPSCQNPISCSPGALPPTLSQSSLETWRGDQNSTSQAFEEALDFRGFC